MIGKYIREALRLIEYMANGEYVYFEIRGKEIVFGGFGWGDHMKYEVTIPCAKIGNLDKGLTFYRIETKKIQKIGAILRINDKIEITFVNEELCIHIYSKNKLYTKMVIKCNISERPRKPNIEEFKGKFRILDVQRIKTSVLFRAISMVRRYPVCSLFITKGKVILKTYNLVVEIKTKREGKLEMNFDITPSIIYEILSYSKSSEKIELLITEGYNKEKDNIEIGPFFMGWSSDKIRVNIIVMAHDN